MSCTHVEPRRLGANIRWCSTCGALFDRGAWTTPASELYVTYDDAFLAELRRAFELDRDKSPAGSVPHDFCSDRIRWIDLELERREKLRR